MHTAHLTVALPLLLMSATTVIAILAIAVQRNHVAVAAISLIGVGASLLSLLFAASAIPQQLSGLLIFDSYSLLYMALLLCSAAFVILLSYNYLKQRHEHREEFYILILLATTGAMVLTASRHFISLFLGLELLSVSLYAMISYIRSQTVSIEAGIKYLVLAASSSSVLLFGLALIYPDDFPVPRQPPAEFPITRLRNRPPAALKACGPPGPPGGAVPAAVAPIPAPWRRRHAGAT